ncbi:tetratricopeptide repeat-containing sulfotransferase family protein [Thalassotalea profundi]|uniref:tetratricopeptide repeat-containing sulfotransferase family protein n=1 Tax=Thalassotalea profundi TaxID=2036687 RepID=UPI0016731CCB|nr:sulfotransferase [Thalassotalea profundi]
MIAFNDNKYTLALSTIKKINAKPSNRSYQSAELEGLASIKLSKFQPALLIFNASLVLAQTEKQKKSAHYNIAITHNKLGNNEEAIKHLEYCQNIDSTVENGQALLLLCELYRRNYHYQKLEKLATKMLAWKEFFAVVKYQLIEAFIKQNNTDKAIKEIQDLTIDLTQINEYYISYAINLLLNLYKVDEAKNLLSRAYNTLGSTPWINKYQAQLALNNKEYKRVLELIPIELINACAEWDKKADYFHIRGNAFDKLAKYQDAYDNFTEMANCTKNEFIAWTSNDYVDDYNKTKLKELPVFLHDCVVAEHIFMIGFPRSGTTLLDTILDTQQNIVTLSELPTVEVVIKAFDNLLNKTYPKNLFSLTNAELKVLHDEYFNFIKTAGFGDAIDRSTILVDKLPLNMIHLPLLLTLFPKAKFIFSLRHPMATCLSNFQQNYLINKEMFHLISFDDCVRRYKKVFDLFGKYLEYYQPDVHFVKYEDLVSDLPNEINRLSKYLNINFSDEYTTFYKRAEKAIIKTPSRFQVNQPLYETSKEKWRGYDNLINQYLPVVQKYIDKYDYS